MIIIMIVFYSFILVSGKRERERMGKSSDRRSSSPCLTFSLTAILSSLLLFSPHKTLSYNLTWVSQVRHEGNTPEYEPWCVFRSFDASAETTTKYYQNAKYVRASDDQSMEHATWCMHTLLIILSCNHKRISLFLSPFWFWWWLSIHQTDFRSGCPNEYKQVIEIKGHVKNKRMKHKPSLRIGQQKMKQEERARTTDSCQYFTSLECERLWFHSLPPIWIGIKVLLWTLQLDVKY